MGDREIRPTLQWVLRHQPLTLIVTAATLVGTILLFMIVPKGFFPIQDTGVIIGISEAPQTFPSTPWRAFNNSWRASSCRTPRSKSFLLHWRGWNEHDVNSGRIQINLKPLDERDASATGVIRRLSSKLEKVNGIQLFMQPVQDITVEDRVSRTQYQYSLEDADPQELATWAPRLLDKLAALPQLRDVASDQQNGGLQANLVINSDTASRLGITPQMIDDTLYDAFGQRQVSTIFTQLNQYHVVLEVDPRYQRNPKSLKDIYVRSANGSQVPLSSSRNSSQPPQPFPSIIRVNFRW